MLLTAYLKFLKTRMEDNMRRQKILVSNMKVFAQATPSGFGLPLPLQTPLCFFQSCFWCSTPQYAAILQFVQSLPGFLQTRQGFFSFIPACV
jgi:hypothetical protein